MRGANTASPASMASGAVAQLVRQADLPVLGMAWRAVEVGHPERRPVPVQYLGHHARAAWLRRTTWITTSRFWKTQFQTCGHRRARQVSSEHTTRALRRRAIEWRRHRHQRAACRGGTPHQASPRCPRPNTSPNNRSRW